MKKQNKKKVQYAKLYFNYLQLVNQSITII